MCLIPASVVLTSLLVAASALADSSNRISQYEMSENSVTQWRLPGRLREVSGLALSPDGRLFTVTDEKAVVYEIDYEKGSLIGAFSFGDPVVSGDFEGITWLGDKLYLTTSDGILYSSPPGKDGEHVIASPVDTGIGKICEIEGLVASPSGDALYFACKGSPKGGNRDYLQIIVWSPTTAALVDNIQLPLAPITSALHVDHFNPSGIAIDPVTGHFIIVAARQKSLLELAADGQLVAARRLRMPNRHRQAEGIELTDDGRLLIADEGGDKKARLAIYRPRKSGESK